MTTMTTVTTITTMTTMTTMTTVTTMTTLITMTTIATITTITTRTPSIVARIIHFNQAMPTLVFGKLFKLKTVQICMNSHLFIKFINLIMETI